MCIYEVMNAVAVNGIAILAAMSNITFRIESAFVFDFDQPNKACIGVTS